MNRDFDIRVDQESPLESLAAELTLAAYRVALRTHTGGTWLDLELDLWRALADTVGAHVHKIVRDANWVKDSITAEAETSC
jgi:hypothetical protein